MAKRTLRQTTRLDSADRKGVVDFIFNHLMLGQRLDLVDKLYASNVVFHTPYSPVDQRGRQAIKNFIRNLGKQFTGQKYYLVSVINEGDWSAVLWRFSGSTVSPESPVSLAQVRDMWGISIWRFEKNKIAEAWSLDTGLWAGG